MCFTFKINATKYLFKSFRYSILLNTRQSCQPPVIKTSIFYNLKKKEEFAEKKYNFKKREIKKYNLKKRGVCRKKGVFFHIFRGWPAYQLKGFADVMTDYARNF